MAQLLQLRLEFDLLRLEISVGISDAIVLLHEMHEVALGAVVEELGPRAKSRWHRRWPPVVIFNPLLAIALIEAL